MKKIVPFIISLLFCVNICAQERMQVRTDNAPLLPFPQLMNNKSEYKDIELLKKDWPLYWLRKGTEVTTEQIRNRRTGEILDEREVGRRTVSRKGGGQDYHSTRYDTERYKIYLNRYLNGDHLALIKYELEFYGEYRG